MRPEDNIIVTDSSEVNQLLRCWNCNTTTWVIKELVLQIGVAVSRHSAIIKCQECHAETIEPLVLIKRAGDAKDHDILTD